MLSSDLNLLGYTIFSNKALPEWKKAYYLPKKQLKSSHYSFFFSGQLTEALAFSSIVYKLKSYNPTAVVWVFADIKTAPAFEGNPYIDRIEIVPFEKWKKHRWERALDEMASWIDSFRHSVGTVYNFSEDPATALLATLLGGNKSYGLLMDAGGRPFIGGSKWMQYAIEVFYPGLCDGVLYDVNLLTRRSILLLALGIKELNGNLEVNSIVNQEMADLSLNYGKCYVSVCPYSQYEARIWPVEYWVELIDKIHREFNCDVLVLCPEGCNQSLPINDKDYVHLVKRLSLSQMAYYLSRSRLFISVHNSYIHFSGLLQVPTLVICGERNQGPEFEGLHLSVRRYVPCSPCYAHSCARKYCLLGLKPDIVFKFVRFLWDSISEGGFSIRELEQSWLWRMLKEELVVEICDKTLPPVVSKYVALGRKSADDLVARILRLGFLLVWDCSDMYTVKLPVKLDLSNYIDWALKVDVNWDEFLAGIKQHVKFLTQWEQKLNFLILRLKDSYSKFPLFFSNKKMMIDPDNLWESLVNFDSSLPVLLKKLVAEIDDDIEISSEEKIREWINQKKILLNLISQYRHFLEDFLFSESQNSDKIQRK